MSSDILTPAADADQPPSAESPPETAEVRAAASGPTSSWVPTVIVVAATLLAVISAATTWVRVQALDTDEWVDTSAQLLDEPQVREALATYLVDELYTGVDVSAQLESRLPETLGGVAGPLAGVLRGPAIDGVERVLERPRLQQAWVEANRLAHATFVAIVRDETGPNVSSSDGAVVLDLSGAIKTVGEDLGLSEAALDRIPADIGQVTVIESNDLADVQQAVRVLDVLSWFLFLVVVALYALAVYLARDRRREMLRNVGIALALGGVTLLAVRSLAVRGTVEAVVGNPTNRPLGRLVGDVFTQLLADMATTAIVIGLVIAAYAALLGPHRWAQAIRERLGRASNPGLIIAVAAIGLLVVLIWWSPGMLFERWITAITVLVLIVGAAIALKVSVVAPATAGRTGTADPPERG